MAPDRPVVPGPAADPPIADRPSETRRGRPRLTLEQYQARLAAYCAKYGVAPTVQGIPPFPAGRRETRQHREWIALYKAHSRLARRSRGQCERCSAPASDGSVFCEAHRADVAARPAPSRAALHGASVEDRRRLLRGQDGRCPVCGRTLEVSDAVDHEGHAKGPLRALLHQPCHQLATLAEQAGPEALTRLRSYLWPRTKRR